MSLPLARTFSLLAALSLLPGCHDVARAFAESAANQSSRRQAAAPPPPPPPAARILAPEVEYRRDTLHATVIFDPRSNVPLTATLRGPGVEKTVEVTDLHGYCTWLTSSDTGPPLDGAPTESTCQWPLRKPTPGSYTLEVRAGARVLSTYAFSLVRVPAVGGKPAFGVEGPDRTGVAYLRSHVVVTWLPHDLLQAGHTYRGVLRRNGKEFRSNLTVPEPGVDRRAVGLVAVGASRVEMGGTYELAIIRDRRELVAAWTFTLGDRPGSPATRHLDVWLEDDTRVFGAVAPLPLETARVSFEDVLEADDRPTRPVPPVDEARVCARLVDPRVDELEAQLRRGPPSVHTSLGSEYDRLLGVTQDPRTQGGARAYARRRMTEIEQERRRLDEGFAKDLMKREQELKEIAARYEPGCFRKLVTAAAATP